LKASRYNWLLEHEGGLAVFNGITGSLAEIDESSKHRVAEALASPEPGPALQKLNPEIRSKLLEAGSFIDRDSDELSSLLHAPRLPLHTASPCSITVIVTTRCNLACGSCTLNPHDGRDIGAEAVNRLVGAIERAGSACLSITLSGGEPLLVPGICVEIGKRAEAACALRGADVKLAISTNGHLLDKRMARRIANGGVSLAKIGIKPGGEAHDRKRFLEGCGSTFSRLIDSIFAAAEHMDVLVTVSCPGEFPDGAGAVLEKMGVAFGRLRNVAISESPVCAAGLSGGGWACMGIPPAIQEGAALDRPAFADGGSPSFVLLPEGSFALCRNVKEAPVSSESTIPGVVAPHPRRTVRLAEWNPRLEQPCRNCRRLPTCGGGCPQAWMATGLHQCAFASDEDYIGFIRAHFLSRSGEGS
jgi:uncharacterized protein